MSARVRRQVDLEALPGGPSRGGAVAGADYDSNALDFSLINECRHQRHKLNTFHTPTRDSQAEEDAACDAAAAQCGTPRLDRGSLYTFREKILSTLRLEFREEASRLRQFFKKAVQEVKDELLADMSSFQQGPAAIASKLLGAVWEVLEEVKESKDKLNLSDVLQTIREHRQEVDLSEVLASIGDIKRRLEIADLMPSWETPRVAPQEGSRPEIDLSEVLSVIRSARAEPRQVDFTEVLGAIRESRAEVDLSGVLAAIKQQGAEMSAAIAKTASDAGGTSGSASLSEVLQAVQKVQAAVDLSPVHKAIEEASQVEATEQACNVEPCLVNHYAVTHAIREKKDGVVEAGRSIQEILSKGHCMGEALGELCEEAVRLASSRSKLAEALTTQAELLAKGKDEIRQDPHAVGDPRETVALDFQPVSTGPDDTEAKLAKLCEQLMAKLEAQHLDIVGMLAHLRCSGTKADGSPATRQKV